MGTDNEAFRILREHLQYRKGNSLSPMLFVIVATDFMQILFEIYILIVPSTSLSDFFGFQLVSL